MNDMLQVLIWGKQDCSSGPISITLLVGKLLKVRYVYFCLACKEWMGHKRTHEVYEIESGF